MPKNVAPAAKNVGGQGTQNELAQVGGGENSVGLAGTSTNDLVANSSLDGSQKVGLPTGDGQYYAELNVELGQQVGAMAQADVNAATSASALMDTRLTLAALETSPAYPVRAVEVTAHRDGYRRAGNGWGKTPQVVKLSELDDDQIAQLQDDPNIRLRGVWVDAHGDSELA